MSDNFRAAMLMVFSMALFALEDAFIKMMAAGIPVYQLLAMIGAFGMLLFWLRMIRRGQPMWSPALLHPMVIARNLGEVGGAFGFVTALAMGELASASAILQMLPLTLVLGAALFLGEKVGWRRWSSVLLGFIGVLLILRPGTEAFQPSGLWALFGVVALTLRDLATRLIPASIPSDQLSGAAYGAMVPAGLLMGLIATAEPVIPSGRDWALLTGTMLFGVTAYSAMVTATRLGEASAVAPFRYTRLGFALVVAVVMFSERPDLPTLAGAGLIAVSGGYAMWREARLRGRRRSPPDGLIRRGER